MNLTTHQLDGQRLITQRKAGRRSPQNCLIKNISIVKNESKTFIKSECDSHTVH